MGAKIKLEGRSAVIEGSVLNSAKVRATDLRAGAALVIAALSVPEGVTEITGVEYIQRGYENIVENLNNLGARVWMEEEEEA
jgi:UDP-N-acetylglucosamine 1-carboxyvinyltransferase